jgi:hypothetical protein
MMAMGQLGQDQTMTAADANLGVRHLQRLLDSWSNDNLQIWTTADATVATVSGTTSYATNTWSNTRVPVTIQNVWLRDSSIDFPLYEISEQEYDAIPAKSTQGLPEAYFFERFIHDYSDDAPPDDVTADDLRGIIYLYPTPNKAYTLHIVGRLSMGNAVTLDSTLVFPPGGELMVMECLAVSLGKFYGIPLTQELMRSASQARKALEPTNHRAPRLATGLPGSGYTTPGYVRIMGDT